MILPNDGPYFPYSRGRFPTGGCASLQLCRRWCEDRPDCNVSLASFTDKRGGTFRVCRSFWADVDVGNGDNSASKYASQLAAIEHIDELIGKSLLPPPIILNSGNGLHLIWSLYDELGEQQWRYEARCLKAHLLAIGLGIDAQRTTDASNGPRVPGTINSKGGELVSIARWSRTSWTAKAWAQIIP
ncbi:MAG: hypothetical protein MN733_29140, partial [Nitrososphaera sp.]|nr:hypothetical protein [Nitrososphaera sp.]